MPDLKKLLAGYREGTLSATERQALLDAPEADVAAALAAMMQAAETDTGYAPQEWTAMIRSITSPEQTPVVPLRRARRWMGYAAAAVLLIIAFAGLWSITRSKKETAPPLTSIDVQPARTGAILRLADGRVIDLDSASGEVAEGFVKEGSQLKVTASDVAYATLECPAGRTLSTLLADGTQVWLNAGSSIRFPTAFNGEKRVVEMKGEAYYEVAKDARRPFIVQTGTDEIEVLGTHFNINGNAAGGLVQTTLLEGKVKVGNRILAPGEQYSGGKIVRADIEQVMAWKNGLFVFRSTSLDQIMQEIGRWYAVKIEYESAVPQRTFSGKMGRELTLSQTLTLLESMRVHFRIEPDQRIVIMP